MNVLQKNDYPGVVLPGRIIVKGVGNDSPIISQKMTVGFARYCIEAGKMEPHNHAEESVYITKSIDAWVRYGDTPACEKGKVPLTEGMLMHFDENEWHVFEYADGGYLEIMFIYGQVDSIRPEEKK